MVYTFLVKDNIFYKIVEHLMIGLAIGYTLTMGVKNVISYGVKPLIAGNYLLIIPLLLGSFLYGRYYKGTRFLPSWPLAVIVGSGIGLAMRGAVQSQIIEQIIATGNVPFIKTNIFDTFNNFVVVVIVISVISYFFFGFQHKGGIGILAKIGRYGMMAAFGAAFGGVVMSRQTWLFGRLQFLVTYPANYTSLVAIILVIFYAVFKLTKRKEVE
jgi:hypothetical protein